MKQREPTYDEKCFELAEHFLQDEPITDAATRADLTKRLAAHIQQSVEDWLNTP